MPQIWHYSLDNMIQLLYGIPKAISFTNFFCNVFDYHYCIIFHPWIKSSPSLSPLRLYQLSRFLLVPFHMGQPCIYISGTRSCWRRSLVCQWWLNMRLGCPVFFWLPNNGRRATKWLFGHWNLIFSVFWGWYFQRNLDCVLVALEQTWTNQGHHGSVWGVSLPFHTLPARPWRKSYWQVIQIDWSPSWPSSLGGF